MTREELLVDLAGRVLALADDRPQVVAIDGMSCVGKTSLADELAAIVDGADRPVVRVSYDDFHQPSDVRHRRDRLSAEGYLLDSYDADALRRLVLGPLTEHAGEVVTASFDLASDEAVSPPPAPVGDGAVVLVEGEFLLTPEFEGAWDLAVLLVAEPAAVLARALCSATPTSARRSRCASSTCAATSAPGRCTRSATIPGRAPTSSSTSPTRRRLGG